MKRWGPLLSFAVVMLALAGGGGCELVKSENPLSPSVAGPIPGVNISAPRLIQPTAGTSLKDKEQPITLVLENATTSGVRPLYYRIELAADAGFNTLLLTKTKVSPGEGGKTELKLESPLPTDRTYYWRARAEDGANTGPFASGSHFSVLAPVIIEKPEPVEPIAGASVPVTNVVLRVSNVRRSGPAGPITYRFELSADPGMVPPLTGALVPEGAGQTAMPVSGLAQGLRYYWRVQAADPETIGPWSRVESFLTAAPPPPPPTGCTRPPTGGWPNNGPAVVAWVASCYPAYLAAGVSSSQRVANMEFLRDRVIEAAICGGMDVAWNLKRGVGPHSIDAVAWRTGGSVEVVDIAADYDNTSHPLSLHWIIVSGPPGYDPYPTPSCR